MKTIYKYIIKANSSPITMHEGAELLSVAFQGNDLCLWAKVETEEPYEHRDIRVFGTGHMMPDVWEEHYEFIGTAHMDNGLVFHVFEVDL